MAGRCHPAQGDALNPPRIAHDLLAGRAPVKRFGFGAPQMRAELVAAREHVQHPWWHHLFQDIGHHERGERGVGRGLRHHGVPGQPRRRELPGQQDHREVPGRDRSHHAERLADHLDALLAIVLQHLGFELEIGVVAEPHRRAECLCHRGGDRLALLLREHGGDVLHATLDGGGTFLQLRTPERLVLLPGLVGARCGGDRLVDVGARSARTAGKRLTRRPVDEPSCSGGHE